MIKNILSTLAISIFFLACHNSPASNDNISENPDVKDKTSQTSVTTENAKDATLPTGEEQTVTPDSPAAPSSENVVSTPPRTSATATPSPERTNVSPAKVAAAKAAAPPTPERKAPPTTAKETNVTATTDTPLPDVPTTKETVETNVSSPPASSVATNAPATSPSPPAFSHQTWDELLRKHVSGTGKVNYKGFKSEKAKLETYLQALQNNPPESSWSKKQAMAYWINAYNAFTIKLIVDNYPVSSITKLEGGKPWDKKWINIGGKSYSLNNIENDILRPKYQDPRIHFAVNCAAKSCPPLLNQAWTADNLERNFEQQAKAFINNPNFNKITSNKVQVSKIFDWYAADFDNLIGFLNKYVATKIAPDARVEFLEYNWDLNE